MVSKSKVKKLNMKNFYLNGTYGITPDNLPSEALIEKIRSSLMGGVKILQYRNKGNNWAKKIEEISEIKKICQKYNVPFIINDNLNIALEVDADGLHVGKDDVSIKKARESLGNNKMLGVSCYGDLQRATKAEKLGADYIAFGSFFKSKTKPKAPLIEKNILEKARYICQCPIVAIGGITPENGSELLKNGADMLAVADAIFSSKDCKLNAQKMARLFQVNLEIN
tara:strand:- start:146 stop:820 length:675 start_codon:yes stop_codon:yes gene_type:complete